MAHVVLLLLVAREDADLGQVGVHEVLEDGVAERAGAARDHQGLVFECGGGFHLLAFLALGARELVKEEFGISN